MPGFEAALPSERQFDFVVGESPEYFSDMQESNIAKYHDIINPYTEFSHDSVEMWKYSQALAYMFRDEDEGPRQVRETFYRSICFALDVTRGLWPTENLAGVSALDELVVGTNDGVEAIRQEVSSYLSSRPHIDNLINYFMSEIDDSGLRNHHAEVGAGAIFLVNERRSGQDYARILAENATMDDLDLD